MLDDCSSLGLEMSWLAAETNMLLSDWLVS